MGPEETQEYGMNMGKKRIARKYEIRKQTFSLREQRLKETIE